jgi:hypothetical protein
MPGTFLLSDDVDVQFTPWELFILASYMKLDVPDLFVVVGRTEQFKSAVGLFKFGLRFKIREGKLTSEFNLTYFF